MTDISLSRHRHPLYAVPRAIGHELEWYFVRSGEDLREGKPWDPERRWSAIAHRVIRGWLYGIDSFDAMTLEVAYATEPRPENLQRRLGRLTTLVIRFAAADAMNSIDPVEQKAHERRTASRLAWRYALHGPRVVRRFVGPAALILRIAVRAYAHQRGRGPSMASRISMQPAFEER